MPDSSQSSDNSQLSIFSHELHATGPEYTSRNRYNECGFSNFVVYVDESGDHGLESVDPRYPVFVLAFCVFYKEHYCSTVVQSLERFKFRHFGHDIVVLHEREIRKEIGDFKFKNREAKLSFLRNLTSVIEDSNFILISCVIDKRRLATKSQLHNNPYFLALGFCLETLYELVEEKKQQEYVTHIIVERRGKKEDNELELEFRRICDRGNKFGKRLPFKIVFADKKVNSAGLQFADLVARPIGLNILRPNQENLAFEVLKRKFFCKGGRMNVGKEFENWGHKVYPSP